MTDISSERGVSERSSGVWPQMSVVRVAGDFASAKTRGRDIRNPE
jgi:hypothetical protein